MLKRTCLILLIAAVPSRRMAELRQWEISGDCFIVCNSTTNVNYSMRHVKGPKLKFGRDASTHYVNTLHVF